MSDGNIGHNGGPTFDDQARENQDIGVLICMKEVIVAAVRDPRLDRRHLRVLAEVIHHMNNATSIAYPGYRAIADGTRRYDDPDADMTFGYTEGGVRNTLSELVALGYLVTTRRAPEKGARALAHYTIRKPTTEELQGQITAWIMAQRSASRRPFPKGMRRASNVTCAPDVTSPHDISANVRCRDDNTPPDVRPRSDIRPPDVRSGSDVNSGDDIRPDVRCDVRSGIPTVTSRKELGESEGSADARASEPVVVPPLPPVPVYPPGNTGEEHRGHGVYLNGHTIRHPAFAISLEGIRMNTINSGLTANEVTERCMAHALQWAVEIENGLRPEKVLPSKIANFLARSIMGEVNQQKIQGVREARAGQPYPPRVEKTSLVDGVVKTETRAERLARMAEEIASRGTQR